MGNCLKRESAAEWGGEEWELPSSKPRTESPPPASSSESEFRRRRRGENTGKKKVRFDARVEVFGEEFEDEELKFEEEKEKIEQVRIRITKKQLEELLGKVELQSLSVHEMMSCLTSGVQLSEAQADDQKPWRRALKMIPES